MTSFTQSHQYKRLRYKWSARQTFADLFSKTWMEPSVPFVVMVLLVVFFSVAIPGFTSPFSVDSLSRGYSEIIFVAFAMGLSLLSGGIDLSVASMFALLDFTALVLAAPLNLPMPIVLLATAAVGAVLGSVNGFFIGILRTRPFLTTLVTLLVYRGIYDLLSSKFGPSIVSYSNTNPAWGWLGGGSFLSASSGIWVMLVMAIIGHILLSRSRWGAHVIAVGSNRRSARHAGINNEKVLFFTYVVSGALCAIGATLYAARLDSVASQVGNGYAFETLAAVMIGGFSLGGGKGSVGRALIGMTILYLLTNGLTQMGLPGQVTSAVDGAVLLIAVAIDSKWMKNRGKAIEKSYINPTYMPYGPLPDLSPDGGGPFAMNDRLSSAEAIGLNEIEGPEDIILDREGRLYGVDRRGWILRFSGEQFEKRELFARVGGRPLGLAFDKDDNLIVCVSGMGLYGVKPNGAIFKITDETNRSWSNLVDDSRLKLTDDVDIAPDGKIFFSEGTIRFDLSMWAVDGIEARGTGRMVCYDPATKRTRTVVNKVRFCNGICMAHDNRSVLYAETYGMTVRRYWLEGPKKGKTELVLDNLPGSPDNINRASDGGYWLALVAMRAPATDIAMRHPRFRIRMIKRLRYDEWLIPGMNNGCIVKLDEHVKPVTSYWDPGGHSHATLTSMREDRGYLYLGGLVNNRIGRIKLDNADPNWTSCECYWGKRDSGVS
jgi:ribose transport system permease protein